MRARSSIMRLMKRFYIAGAAAGVIVALYFLVKPAGLTDTGWRCTLSTMFIALLWMTESLPIPVVSLLPIVIFPLLGVSSLPTVAKAYADPIVFLFIGGSFIALSMERWNLHRRIGLSIVSRAGNSTRRLILGIMIATAFISMWVSNTATTLMMFPIVVAIVTSLRRFFPDEKNDNFGKACAICVAYAASIGGIGTLVGTAPNVVFQGAAARVGGSVSFLDWFLVGLPVVVLLLPAAWLILIWKYPPELKELKGAQDVIRGELEGMGKMNSGEIGTLVIFIITALLWVTSQWWTAALGVKDVVTDSTIAIAMGILLFIIPAKTHPYEPLMNWEYGEKFPWGILLLFGAGFSIADAMKDTGVSVWLGSQISALGGLPEFAIVAVVCFIVTFLTEVTSNTATCMVLMPVMISAAAAAGMHPYMLMLPAAISCSCAFMLPVATPPNAIVFGMGNLKVRDMAIPGFWLNLAGVVIVTVVMLLVGKPVFKIT